MLEPCHAVGGVTVERASGERSLSGAGAGSMPITTRQQTPDTASVRPKLSIANAPDTPGRCGGSTCDCRRALRSRACVSAEDAGFPMYIVCNHHPASTGNADRLTWSPFSERRYPCTDGGRSPSVTLTVICLPSRRIMTSTLSPGLDAKRTSEKECCCSIFVPSISSNTSSI